MRILPAGDLALLIEPDGDFDAAVAALRSTPVPGVQDVLPAAETILVTLETGADRVAVTAALGRVARRAEAASGPVGKKRSVVIPVRYDGTDLASVAEILGTSVDEVIARHTAAEWHCRFIGFSAGFGYLVAPDAGLTVPRRAQSRTVVPRGAVALAGGYSAVYPRQGPGGWQLIGSTDAPMWDLQREAPALLTPGTAVRFEAIDP